MVKYVKDFTFPSDGKQVVRGYMRGGKVEAERKTLDSVKKRVGPVVAARVVRTEQKTKAPSPRPAMSPLDAAVAARDFEGRLSPPAAGGFKKGGSAKRK